MELKDQVCSLELAKILKELGMKQKSFWWWLEQTPYDANWICEQHPNMPFPHGECDGPRMPAKLEPFIMNAGNTSKHGGTNFYKEEEGWDYYSALTVAELGEKLPFDCQTGKDNINGFVCSCWINDVKVNFSDKFEANARAKMLIYLLENKLVEEG